MITDPNEHISIEQVSKFVLSNEQLSLNQHTKETIIRCRTYLENKIKSSKEPIYGINTGFGSLCNNIVPSDQMRNLQYNLLRSHACGTGSEIPSEIVRLMLLLKIKSLSKGFSGVQLETVERLVTLYNLKAIPVVYEQGSLGASGDLAPLSHLCLPIFGEGKLTYNGKTISGETFLKEAGLEPVSLGEKEGLALINGTQFMSAYGVWCLNELTRLSRWADVIAAMSTEAFDGRTEPFSPESHEIRPHPGQIETAKNISELREGSQIAVQPKKQVQDPYSFRCIPQVHGACKQVLQQAKSIIETEINAVTDNPNVFPDADKILSAGNFHGEILAFQLDFAAIAASELASISERRIYKLISGERGLPLFLTPNAGLNSGYMIAQYTAASIVSQNKQLSSPASVDSIVSSNGQEDHVSMGANAATKLYRVTNNLRTVLAIELLCACQGLDFQGADKTSNTLKKLHDEFRKVVPFREKDTFLHDDITRAEVFLNEQTL
ncbi:MAG: histidine ammonia-lyase [Bacteroidetes bacterium]|nr:histidine ammonia-lyase [Bacteroidota bacterium]